MKEPGVLVPPRIGPLALSLFLPVLLLLFWLFHNANVIAYIKYFYLFRNDWPVLVWAPALLMFLGVLVAIFTRDSDQELDTVSDPAPGVFILTLLLLAASPLLCGTELLKNLAHGFLGVLVFLAALSLGLRVLVLQPFLLLQLHFISPFERLVIGGAIGIGGLSLLVFCLGSLGILSPWFWWAVILLLCFQGTGILGSLIGEMRRASSNYINAAGPISAGIATWLICYLGMHVVLVWSPPVKYDILEYHLGAVAEYLRDQRISFLHENIYAAFPEVGEMQYLLSMILAGGKYAGLPAAHFMVFAAWGLTVCGVYSLARRLLEGEPMSPAPILAALLYATVPMATDLAADFWVEHFQALFHLVALLCACIFIGNLSLTGEFRLAWLVLAGLATGFCCGTKYPALLFTFAPLATLVPLYCLQKRSFADAVRAAACLVIPPIALLSPWLVRNVAMTGDPVYPIGKVFLRRLYGTSEVADRFDHFDVAHRAGQKSLGALLQTLRQLMPGFGDDKSQWLTDGECGPQLLAFALPGFLSAVNPAALLCAIIFILDLAIWFLFTHRLNRFMFPLLSPLAVIGGLGVSHLWRSHALRLSVLGIVATIVMLICPLPMIFLWLYSQPDHVAGILNARDASHMQYILSGDCDPRSFEAWTAINALPPSSHVLCLGDSQTFYLDKTPCYSVVFNTPILEEILNHSDDVATALLQLKIEGITHIYINYSELNRLDASYSIVRDTSGQWHYARPEDKRLELRKQLLQQNRWKEYGNAWPAGALPAYLKLTPAGYAILDEILNQHTIVEQVWDDGGWKSCEIRKLK